MTHPTSTPATTTIYDGNLTAWLEMEIDKVLGPILPPVGKLYEGKNTFEVQTRDPRYNQAKETLVAIAREYAQREKNTPPVKATGEVYHGCEND